MYSVSRLGKILLLWAFLALVATTAASTNEVQVFVHPGSGTVCLDTMCQVEVGTLSGYSSTRFEGVTGGQDHTIRVYNTAGYEDYSETIYMDFAGDFVTSRIYLEPVSTGTPAPGTGDIQAFVSPGLGQVCIDNRECESSIGETVTTWSVRFSDVSSDAEHTLTVTADGYQPYSTQVTVQPGGISDVEISLQPLASGASSAGSPQKPIPTRAASAGFVAFFAAGIIGVAFLCRKQGR